RAGCLVVRATLLMLAAPAARPPRRARRPAAREPQDGGLPVQEETWHGLDSFTCHWRAGRLRRVAAAAAPHLPGDHGPVADLVCRPPLQKKDTSARFSATSPLRASGGGCRTGGLTPAGAPLSTCGIPRCGRRD